MILIVAFILLYSQRGWTQTKKIIDKEFQIVVFLSTDCPISISYGNTLDSLTEIYNKVDFVFIFPKTFKRKSKSFLRKHYTGHKRIRISKSRFYINLLKPTVTPEVFLIDRNTSEILYSGAIDDRYVELGKRKTINNEHYLQSAIRSVQNGLLPEIKKTKAIGCLIE